MADALTLDPTQYDLARKRAAQQNTSAVQGQQDALKRRFASLGSLNSGAAIKQSQLAEEAGQQNLTNANQNIDAAQAQEGQRLNEIKQGQEFSAGQADLQRKFQTGERLGGQDYASIQADLQRKFATGERLSSQDFANLQRLGSQDFAKGENDANRSQQYQQYLGELQFKQNAASQQQNQFDAQMSLANKQFTADQATTAFNEKMAEDAANSNGGGLFGSLFGGGAGNTYFGKTFNNGVKNDLGFVTYGASSVLGF